MVSGVILLTMMLFVLPDASKPASAIAAEPMNSDDPKAWNSLLTEKDVDAVMKYLVREIEGNTKAESVFRKNYRRLERDGYLVALLGNIEATKRPDDSKKAVALREAGRDLAASAKKKDFAQAKHAADVIAGFPGKTTAAADGKPAKWEDVVALEQLMKSVSLVDTNVRKFNRSTGAEYSKKAADGAAEARMLACIALAARQIKSEKDWQDWCDQLREGSVDLAGQFSKKNAAGSKAAHEKLQKTCNDCHEKYRDTAN